MFDLGGVGDPSGGSAALPGTVGGMADPNAKRAALMAQMLRSQGSKQPQGQMVGGNYVAPSAGQQLTPLLSQIGSAYMGR